MINHLIIEYLVLLCFCLFVLLFFFFKQKTAYEMRISDWISDVCSSDLFGLQKILPGDPVLAMAGEERDPAVLDYLRDKYRLNDPLPVQYLAWIQQVGQCKIGRAHV